jgi:hypothetical protein
MSRYAQAQVEPDGIGGMYVTAAEFGGADRVMIARLFATASGAVYTVPHDRFDPEARTLASIMARKHMGAVCETAQVDASLARIGS